MNQFEMIVIGLLLTMIFGMFVIGKWVIVTMINSRLINRKIEQHTLIDLELRFFRFLHFNGEKEEGSKYYLGRIIKTFKESKSDSMDKKDDAVYLLDRSEIVFYSDELDMACQLLKDLKTQEEGKEPLVQDELIEQREPVTGRCLRIWPICPKFCNDSSVVTARNDVGLVRFSGEGVRFMTLSTEGSIFVIPRG